MRVGYRYCLYCESGLSARSACVRFIAMTRFVEKETFVSVSGMGGHFLIDMPAVRTAIAAVLTAARGRSGDPVIPVLDVVPGRSVEDVFTTPSSRYLLDAGRFATDILLSARLMGIPAVLAAGNPSELKETYPGSSVHYAVALRGPELSVCVQEFRYDSVERESRAHMLFEGGLNAFVEWANGRSLKVVSSAPT